MCYGSQFEDADDTNLSQAMYVLQGNPFCLQPNYHHKVQTALPCLKYFDGNQVSWPSADNTLQPCSTSGINADSLADEAKVSVPPSAELHLQIAFRQLSVQKAVSGRLPTPETASEPCPPLYHYYVQLRTVDGSSLCSFPVILTPQDELADWQAKQAAEPMAASKKAAKKAPAAAAKGSEADADAAHQRNAWYPEVILLALPYAQTAHSKLLALGCASRSHYDCKLLLSHSSCLCVEACI